jgi:hypothetical protein
MSHPVDVLLSSCTHTSRRQQDVRDGSEKSRPTKEGARRR